MIQPEFVGEMARMQKCFGNFYNEIRSATIWRIAQHSSIAEFRECVDGFVKNARQAPTPAEFLTSLANIRRRTGDNFLPTAQIKTLCRSCLDCGFHYAKTKFEGITVFVKCDCDIGKQQTVAFLPHWQSLPSSEYEKIPIDAREWKPKEFFPNEETDKKLFGQVEKLLELWETKMKIAKEYWRNARSSEPKV